MVLLFTNYPYNHVNYPENRSNICINRTPDQNQNTMLKQTKRNSLKLDTHKRYKQNYIQIVLINRNKASPN